MGQGKCLSPAPGPLSSAGPAPRLSCNAVLTGLLHLLSDPYTLSASLRAPTLEELQQFQETTGIIPCYGPWNEGSEGSNGLLKATQLFSR